MSNKDSFNNLITAEVPIQVVSLLHVVKVQSVWEEGDEAQKNSPNSFKPKLIILFLMFSQELFNQFLDAITSLDLGYECKKERKKESK